MAILMIASHAAFGQVGGTVAVFALRRLGFEVRWLPTTALSNHPGFGRPKGRVTPAREIRDLINGLSALGRLSDITALLTGYLGDPATGPVVGRLKRRLPDGALWLCDPILGDDHTGIYVDPGLVPFFRRSAARADVLTPNRFELATMTGRPVGTPAEVVNAVEALRERGPRLVVCTSVATEDRMGIIFADGRDVVAAMTPRLATGLHGSGDLFAALLLGGLLKGDNGRAAAVHALNATYAVLKASLDAGSDRLLLTETQDALVAPPDVCQLIDPG